jgi:hypothetical protein
MAELGAAYRDDDFWQFLQYVLNAMQMSQVEGLKSANQQSALLVQVPAILALFRFMPSTTY